VFYNAISEATESLRGSKADPTLLNAMEKAAKNHNPTYEDLQGDYSALGKELSKGTLPGDVFHTYDRLHEAVGNEMQRIADSKGMGAALTDARAYWKRMKQTFGKPLSIRDAATKAMGGAADAARANEIRLLGSFDPEIPGKFAHVENVEKGLKALPKPVPARTLTAKLAESRQPAPELAPAPPPKPVAPPERVLPSDRPAETPTKKIGSADIQQAKAEGLEKRASLIEHRGTWVAAWPLFHIMSQIVHGDVVSLPADVAASAATYGGVQGVASILRNPTVANFLTKATARDFAQVPADLRGDMPTIISTAQKSGVRVSPALLGAVMGSRNYPLGPNTKRLKQTSDELRANPQP
jgi:hypothetical protein